MKFEFSGTVRMGPTDEDYGSTEGVGRSAREDAPEGTYRRPCLGRLQREGTQERGCIGRRAFGMKATGANPKQHAVREIASSINDLACCCLMR